jgi:DNA polymerase elongation subunit (family B)
MNRIFYDLETAPNIGLFWRPGYKVSLSADNIIQERFVICVCWKVEGEKEIHSLTCDKKNSDEKMIKRFSKIINKADEIVAHNGDRFDLPWIKGRAFQLGVPVSPQIKTVDTLAWARKMGLNSNRLDYIGKYRFSEGKTSTNYDMWKKIVVNRDQSVLKQMVDYCKNDVVLQEKAYNALAPYHLPKSHVGVMNGCEKWTCPYTGSKHVVTNLRRVSASGTVKWQMKNKDTGQYFTINDKAHRDYLKAKDTKKGRKAA